MIKIIWKKNSKKKWNANLWLIWFSVTPSLGKIRSACGSKFLILIKLIKRVLCTKLKVDRNSSQLGPLCFEFLCPFYVFKKKKKKERKERKGFKKIEMLIASLPPFLSRPKEMCPFFLPNGRKYVLCRFDYPTAIVITVRLWRGGIWSWSWPWL